MTAPADEKPSPRINLGDFLLLPENQFAARAIRTLARAVVLEKPASMCPLFLHGAPGCGKSHLTSAFLAAVTQGLPELIARIEPAGDLARLESTGEDAGFADRDLVTCDALILEDIQHLPERAADGVCALLDQRARRRKALIVTSGIGPAGLTQLPHRLTSRLASGLVVPLQTPGAASRMAILKAVAAKKKLRLSDDACEWLAEQTAGLRSAIGSLSNLALLAPQYPGPLDRSIVQEILAQNEQPTSREGSVAAIIRRVAAAFGIAEKQLLGSSRLRNVLVPRQVAMYLVRELAGLSLPRIGTAFGRDHTTVLHACRKIEELIKTDAVLNGRVRQLRGELT